MEIPFWQIKSRQYSTLAADRLGDENRYKHDCRNHEYGDQKTIKSTVFFCHHALL